MPTKKLPKHPVSPEENQEITPVAENQEITPVAAPEVAAPVIDPDRCPQCGRYHRNEVHQD